MFTFSRQPIDIRLLPSIVPPVIKNQTSSVIKPELVARIQKLEDLIDAGVVDSDSSSGGGSIILLLLSSNQPFSLSEDPPKTACRFMLYAQMKPVPVSANLMQELEEEIRKPTGSTTVTVPKLSIDGLLISKECGVLYQIHRTEGLRFVHLFGFFVELNSSFVDHNHFFEKLLPVCL